MTTIWFYVVSVLLCFRCETVYSNANVHVKVSLSPEDNYQLQLQCTAAWKTLNSQNVTYPNSLAFYNSRNPHDITTASCTTLGVLDLDRCRETLRLSFGLGTWSDCYVNGTYLTATVKLVNVEEIDLCTWTCEARFTDPDTGLEHNGRSSSSTAYDMAAITRFPDHNGFNIGILNVVPIGMTESGGFKIGCSISGLESALTVKDSNQTGVPFKTITFNVDEVTYEGDIFERSSSNEIAQCSTRFRNNDISLLCFTQHHDFREITCKGHSFTLLAEPTTQDKQNQSSVFNPLDTSDYFMFPSLHRGGFQVRLTQYLVFENPPRSVSCYPVFGKGGVVCLGMETLQIMFSLLLDLTVRHTRLKVIAVSDHVLRCSRGPLVAIVSPECLGKEAVCNVDGGFKPVVVSKRLDLTHNFTDLGCVVSYYYCFERSRKFGRYVSVISTPQTIKHDDTFNFTTSEDIASQCREAHSPMSSKDMYQSYGIALTTFMAEKQHHFYKSMHRQTSLLTCPCVQVPKTCPGSFPIVGTIDLNEGNIGSRSLVTCSLFNQVSKPKRISDLLRTLACSVNGTDYHNFLPPPTPSFKEGSRIQDSDMGRDHVVLNCTTPADTCRNIDPTKSIMSLVTRNWTGITEVEIHNGDGLLFDPVLFATRYETVQCHWVDSVNGTLVSASKVLDLYEQLSCKVDDAYELDIWWVNETTVECVSSYADPLSGCPPVHRLDFQNITCTSLECYRAPGGHEISLTLTNHNTHEREEIFTCSASRSTHSSSNIQVNTITKTMRDLRRARSCQLSITTPRIVQHTSKQGDVFVTCRYPLTAGNIRYCERGVKIAFLKLISRKVGPKSGQAVVMRDENKETSATWITYSLNLENTVKLSSRGNLQHYVRPSGYRLPNKNVVAAKVSRDYFTNVTANGNIGISVHAYCTFVYETEKRRSSPVSLVGGVIHAYERSQLAQTFSKSDVDWSKNTNSQRKPTVIMETGYPALLYVMTFLAIFVLLIATVVTVAIMIAPTYKT